MADLVQTPANVVSGTGATTQRKTAAVAISAGAAVYVNGSNQLDLCENDQTATEAACAGIALNDAAAGQPVVYQTSGRLNVGATLTAGEVYVVGAAPGAIAPVADVIATEFMTVLGVGVSTSEIEMGLLASGVAAG